MFWPSLLFANALRIETSLKLGFFAIAFFGKKHDRHGYRSPAVWAWTLTADPGIRDSRESIRLSQQPSRLGAQ